jgi:hypothetical protein
MRRSTLLASAHPLVIDPQHTHYLHEADSLHKGAFFTTGRKASFRPLSEHRKPPGKGSKEAKSQETREEFLLDTDNDAKLKA